MDRRQFLSTAVSSAVFATAAKSFASPESLSLAKTIEASGFCGTACIARGNEVLLQRGFREAERNFATPCAVDTRYHIASITKLFTATVVLQLVAENKIGLDQTIGKYLPNYRGPAKDKSRIVELLHHTSGIENFDKSLSSFTDAERTGMPAYQMPHTSEDLLDRFASGPLIHPPRTAFDYNNGDFVILGKIIEAIESISFAEVLQKRILQPLRLESTGLFPSRVIQPKLASTYCTDKDHPLGNDLPVYFENWYAAGGMTSTAPDLLTFSRALFGGKLVSLSSLEKMLTPGLNDYGFGLWFGALDIDGKKYRFAQRPGRIMGANTLLLHFLDTPLDIILLGNTNLADTDALGFTLAKSVLST